MTFLIWSWEKEQWWAPDRQGYTSDINLAGRYSFEEAAKETVPHIPAGEEVAVLETLALQDGRPFAYGCG